MKEKQNKFTKLKRKMNIKFIIKMMQQQEMVLNMISLKVKVF